MIRILAIFTLLFPLLASALDPAEERLGFVALSDGKTFDGWKQSGNWEIQDGAFARVRPSGQLVYEKQLIPDDFELRFDWKVSKGCNSGVYYRPGQVEYQVLDDEHSPYGENPRQSAASLFFCMAPSKRAARPYGEWNTARIICKGSVIEHWLNEERVLSFDYTDPRWAKEVELLTIRGGDLTGRGGKLLLQDHGQDVSFRNLRLRTIPAEEKLIPDPNFQPMPVPPAALEKENARVRGMLEKARQKTTSERRWRLLQELGGLNDLPHGVYQLQTDLIGNGIPRTIELSFKAPREAARIWLMTSPGYLAMQELGIAVPLEPWPSAGRSRSYRCHGLKRPGACNVSVFGSDAETVFVRISGSPPNARF